MSIYSDAAIIGASAARGMDRIYCYGRAGTGRYRHEYCGQYSYKSIGFYHISNVDQLSLSLTR